MEPESNQSQRMEAVEKWALFVKNNPDNWKKIHTEFINAQFEKAYKAIDKILKEKGYVFLNQTNYTGTIPKILGKFWG